MTDEQEYDFIGDTCVGHFAGAYIEERSELSKELDDVAEELDIERSRPSPMVKIVTGDVAWDDTKSLRVRLDTLQEMVDELEKKP